MPSPIHLKTAGSQSGTDRKMAPSTFGSKTMESEFPQSISKECLNAFIEWTEAELGAKAELDLAWLFRRQLSRDMTARFRLRVHQNEEHELTSSYLGPRELSKEKAGFIPNSSPAPKLGTRDETSI